MKILYVINNAYTHGNGLAGSCRRMVRALREQGEDVRILSAPGAGGERPDYPLPGRRLPLIQPLIDQQGYAFARWDPAVVREAVRWADVVHLEEPFGLERRVAQIARQEGRPLTATYHLHPENLFATVHLQRAVLCRAATMWLWRKGVFDCCAAIQCPTRQVYARLERWGFSGDLRVISNGALPPAAAAETPPLTKPAGTYLLIATGRYSVEKDQRTLLRAMRYSRFSREIQLVLAGRGPTEAALRRQAAGLLRAGILRRPVIFGFYDQAELRALYAQADLYIHCATVEVEGMACMEAVETGLVPVIAQGPLTAASQFALRPESCYPAGDARALAARIDDWLEHDQARRQEARRYVGLGTQYDIRRSAAQLQKMYQDVASSPQNP